MKRNLTKENYDQYAYILCDFLSLRLGNFSDNVVIVKKCENLKNNRTNLEYLRIIDEIIEKF